MPIDNAEGNNDDANLDANDEGGVNQEEIELYQE